MLLSRIHLFIYNATTSFPHVFCMFPFVLSFDWFVPHSGQDLNWPQSPYGCQLFIDIRSGQPLQGKKFLFTPFCRLITELEIITEQQALVLMNSVISAWCVSAGSHISSTSRDFQNFLCCLQGLERSSCCTEHQPKRGTEQCAYAQSSLTPHKTPAKKGSNRDKNPNKNKSKKSPQISSWKPWVCYPYAIPAFSGSAHCCSRWEMTCYLASHFLVQHLILLSVKKVESFLIFQATDFAILQAM